MPCWQSRAEAANQRRAEPSGPARLVCVRSSSTTRAWSLGTVCNGERGSHDQLRHAGQLVEIDLRHFVAHFVIVVVQSRRVEHDRNAALRIAVVIAAQVDLLGMIGGIPLAIDREWASERRIDGIDRKSTRLNSS